MFLAIKSLQISIFFRNRDEGAEGTPIFTRPFRILLAKDFSTILAHVLYLQISNFLQNRETEAGATRDFTRLFRTFLAAGFSIM